MGTRSNLYKNPSIAYKKDFSLSSVLQNLKGIVSYLDYSFDLFPIDLQLNLYSCIAYNIVTGNASTSDDQDQPPIQGTKQPDTTSTKRRRLPQPQQCRSPAETEEDNDGPMSHQDYINKRRQFIKF